MLALLFLIVVAYVGLTALETGGPNHGEHPFLVTLVHLGLFLWLADDWAPASLSLYQTLLFCALGYSLICLLTVHTWLRYVNAVVMVAFYLAFFYLLNFHEHRTVPQPAAAPIVTPVARP